MFERVTVHASSLHESERFAVLMARSRASTTTAAPAGAGGVALADRPEDDDWVLGDEPPQVPSARETADGVFFDSRAWLVSALRDGSRNRARP